MRAGGAEPGEDLAVQGQHGLDGQVEVGERAEVAREDLPGAGVAVARQVGGAAWDASRSG